MATISKINKARLEEIRSRYNPDYDIPDGPQVPWAVWYLTEIIENLVVEIDKINQTLKDRSQP